MLNYTLQFGSYLYHGSIPDDLLSSLAQAVMYEVELGAPYVNMLDSNAVIDRSNGETRSYWGINIPGSPRPIDVPTLEAIQWATVGYAGPSAGIWLRDAKGNIVLDESHGPSWIPTAAPPAPTPGPGQAPGTPGAPPELGGAQTPTPNAATEAIVDALNSLTAEVRAALAKLP